MQTPRQKLGRNGEEDALWYLVELGYKLLHRNFRIGRAEIDLIFHDPSEDKSIFEKQIVFVEVKTRKSAFHGFPEESISDRQIDVLSNASEIYQEDHPNCLPIRFDVVAILKTQNTTRIKHFKDAFCSWRR